MSSITDPSVGDIALDVENNIRNAQSYASSTMAGAQQFLNALSQSVSNSNNIPYISLNNTIPNVSIQADIPIAPQAPQLMNIQTPSLTSPQLADLRDIQITDIPDLPNFSDEIPNEPRVNLDNNLPNSPKIAIPTLPAAPTIDLPKTPDIKDIQLPEIPTIEYINIDTIKPIDIKLPEFNPSIDYNEEEYDSDLKNALTTKIINTITQGGTALPKNIEQEIFDREKERSDYQVRETIKTILDTWASRGFSLPMGMMQAEIEKVMLDYQHSRLDISRDIAIKQAELEQQNIQNAIAEGNKLEQANMQFANEVRDRAYKIAVALGEFAINVYNAKITSFNLLLEEYKSKLQANELKLRSNLAKVEIYKSQIDGKKLESEVQQQRIQEYIALVDALKSQIDIYKTQVDAVRNITQSNLANVDLFKAQTDAYIGRLTAETKKYDVYNSQINAYRAKVDAYRAKADAQASKARIEEIKANTQLKINDGILQRNQAEVEKFKIDAEVQIRQMEAEIENLKGQVQIYSSQMQGYSAQVNAEAEATRVQVEAQRLTTEVYKQNALVALEQAKANLTAFIENVRIQEAAAQGGAQVYASMVNGALNSINTAVSLGAKLIQTESLNVNI